MTADERAALEKAGLSVSESAEWQVRATGEGWQLWDPGSQRRWASHASGDQLELRRWENWYEYERSYWLPAAKQGVDRGEPNPWIYAFHALAGHHGIFSLTPIWLLSLGGVWWAIRQRPSLQRQAILSIALVSAVCLLFYLTRPQVDRNYGGVSCGLRWMIWLTPLWLYCMLPVLDRWFARRAWQILAWCLFLASAFSAWYPAWNPWSHPWILQWALEARWIELP